MQLDAVGCDGALTVDDDESTRAPTLRGKPWIWRCTVAWRTFASTNGQIRRGWT